MTNLLRALWLWRCTRELIRLSRDDLHPATGARLLSKDRCRREAEKLFADNPDRSPIAAARDERAAWDLRF